MAEAQTKDIAHERTETVPAAIASGEIYQLADGRAAVFLGLNAAASGDEVGFVTEGQFTVLKTDSTVVLKGGRVYWDTSASTATPLEAFGADDFYLGLAVEDAASADTTLVVDINARQSNAIDLQGDTPWDTVVILTAGTPDVKMRGGSATASFSATAEAQKVDLLSKQSVLAENGFIAEFKLSIEDNGDDAALDINIGVANATHATDADAITESVFIHVDGNVLDLLAESDDGTTEVAATDTTVNYAEGTSFEIWMDARDITDIQIYIDAVLVLGASVFVLTAATGPIKALFHMEKTSNDTPADVRISRMSVRTMDLMS